jgi:ESS family glutamate:Na+ symporter
VCVGLGLAVRPLVTQAFGVTVPAFLAVLLTAVLLTNLSDLAKVRIDLEAADLVGTLALRVFLAVAMMGLQLAAVRDSIGLIFTTVVCQVLITAALAIFAVYPLFKGRDGSVAAAGFVGFGLGAMPVGLAAMKRLTATYGPAPRAILIITLAASFTMDTANALVVQTFLGWLGR